MALITDMYSLFSSDIILSIYGITFSHVPLIKLFLESEYDLDLRKILFRELQPFCKSDTEVFKHNI